MKVLCCKPGEEFKTADMTADEIINYCEGLIDIVEFPNTNAILVVNDEGRINGMEMNRALCYDSNVPGVTTPKIVPLHGPIVVVGVDAEGEFKSLKPRDRVAILDAIGEPMDQHDINCLRDFMRSEKYRADRKLEDNQMRAYYENMGFAYFNLEEDM